MNSWKRLSGAARRIGKATSQRTSRGLDRSLGKPLAWRVRLLWRVSVYLGGRDATLLLSALAFSFLVSIFPFIVLLLNFAAYVEWAELREVIFSTFFHFFPISQEFIIRNLRILTRGAIGMQVISLAILTWSVSAFFFSLEACLDSAYRVPEYRRFARSQVLGTAMTVLFGVVAFCFMAALRGVQVLSRDWFHVEAKMRAFLEDASLLGVGILLTLVFFYFLFYHLPNQRRKPRRVVAESLFAGTLWWVGNWIFRAMVPFWSLQEIYGPFYVSVTILLWAFASGAVLMATARLSADGFFSRYPKRKALAAPAEEKREPEPVQAAPEPSEPTEEKDDVRETVQSDGEGAVVSS